MIVCSCQHISDRDIHAAIDWMRAADPRTVITPGKIYRALGKSPDCGGCMKLFVATARANPQLKVAARAVAPAAGEVPLDLRDLRAYARETGRAPR